MRYLNLEVEIVGDMVRILRADSFTPSHIFDNGQCFRWERIAEEHYIGVAMDKVLEVKKAGDHIELINTDFDEFSKIWYDYFDFGTDYNRIKEVVAVDEFSSKAVQFADGLRILRQDYFEVVISFIISQNNNIPRIKRIIDEICQKYGESIQYKGKIFKTFPKEIKFKGLDTEDLEFCRAGYRCDYISAITKNRTPSAIELKRNKLEKQRKMLLSIKGIGPKVAECILLFSGINTKAFPIDTWIKKIMKSEYGIHGNNNDMYNSANKLFNQEPGFAQQYLFYYGRSTKL